MIQSDVKTKTYKVESVRHLSPSSYVLRFSREGMEFKPGQHLNMGLAGSKEHREYSIYSGANDTSLEVLIKEVDDGTVSTQLKNLKPGDQLSVKGPYGFFLTDIKHERGEKLLFIASGTGIAPFHSYIKTFPDVEYRIVHGIRNMDEAYEAEHYAGDRYHTCTSRGSRGDYVGRVTDFLMEDEAEKADRVYLCGNSSMIYDAMDILRARGYRHDQLFTEVYF